MKQKKFGKKIQNWHKPFNPNDLSQRFIRSRVQDPSVDHKLSEDDVSGLWTHIDRSDAFGFTYWDPDYEGEMDEFKLSFGEEGYLRYQIEEMIFNALDAKYQPEWKKQIASKFQVSQYEKESPEQLAAAIEFEAELVQHLKNLEKYNLDSLRTIFNDSIYNHKIADFLKKIEQQEVLSNDAVTSLLTFAPFWFRQPDAWPIENDVNSLVDHLFVIYPPPAFLYKGWHGDYVYFRSKWLIWFILLAQGGSLQRVAKYFNWIIPNGFQHYLYEAPQNVSPIEACIYAEVRRLGGNDQDFNRILRTSALVFDPTESSYWCNYKGFWHRSVRWIIANRNALNDEEFDLVLDWAVHMNTEARRIGAEFSWKGRSVRAVLERSLEYEQERKKPWANYHWDKHGWDWAFEDDKHNKWTIVELTSGEALFEEGKKLRHCVSGYAPQCVAGYSAILSMRLNGVPKVTIEVNPVSKIIVQARGFANANPGQHEKSITQLWASQMLKAESIGS